MPMKERAQSRESRIRTLVLYANYTTKFSYFDDWLDAFLGAPEFDATGVNIREGSRNPHLRGGLNEFDLIVLLHSTNGDSLDHLRRIAPLLQSRRGKLLSFVGNEVNLPGSFLADKIAMLKRLGADFIATQLEAEAGRWLYADCGTAQVVSVPHALNPEGFRSLRPQEQRPIDIGTRSHRYLPYLGDDERNRLFDFFSAHAFDPSLVVDIDTEERFDREQWAGFLNHCKGTVSNEAGSYFLERDDRTVRRIMDDLIARKKAEPRLGIVLPVDAWPRRLFRLLPRPLRAILAGLSPAAVTRAEMIHLGADPEEILTRYFRNRKRAPVYTKCISSRHFDAIGTRTCQIMLRGRFNGILEADRHYLALEHDLSNIGPVMARFSDPVVRGRLVDEAHDHVMAGHTYRHRMTAIAGLVQ
jgi:hypothetical protein